MPEAKQIRGPSDIGFINLPSEAERHYWAREFGCTQEQLAQAVATVGPLVVDVRWHLGNRLQAVPGLEEPSCPAQAARLKTG